MAVDPRITFTEETVLFKTRYGVTLEFPAKTLGDYWHFIKWYIRYMWIWGID